MISGRVLVVDDDPKFAGLLVKLCHDSGHAAEGATSRREALAMAERFSVDVALVDLHLGNDSGIALLRELRVLRPALPAIVISAYADVRSTVAAMRAGACDIIEKPIDNERLVAGLGALLRKASPAECPDPQPTGRSPAYRRVVEIATRMASADLTVLLLGETGTGKEVLAHLIHARSQRSKGPFVALDCSALSESLIESELFGYERGAFTGASQAKRGLVEMATGGTLFLDEIGNLPVGLQPKLLRAIETRSAYRVGGILPVRYDVRLIAATNDDLQARVEAGTFRRDLYHRLCEVEVRLPPLRERREDIPLLVEHFVGVHAAATGRPAQGLGPDVLAAFDRYAWPGNVRELKNVLRAALVLADGADVIELGHFPEKLKEATAASRAHSKSLATGKRIVNVSMEFVIAGEAELDFKGLVAQAGQAAEGALLGALLGDGQGGRTRLARRLGIDEKTLRAKLRIHGLENGGNGA